MVLLQWNFILCKYNGQNVLFKSIKNLHKREKNRKIQYILCGKQTNLLAASKLLFTKSLKGRICSSFVKRTWLAMLWRIWKKNICSNTNFAINGEPVLCGINQHLLLPVIHYIRKIKDLYEPGITLLTLTLDMSLRPRSMRGGGFLSRMPASYGDTIAGLMKRKNMALPTAPILFWGNRWLTTCTNGWRKDNWVPEECIIGKWKAKVKFFRIYCC